MTSENHPYQPADDSGKPPLPKIKKMRWPFPIIWIVPVIAACLAGYYVEQHHQENGIEIAISFDDGSGLKPGETTVVYSGVTVGHVKTIELSPDRTHAVAHVQFSSKDDYLTRADTLFWLVRPEVSFQNISGLNTLVSGPYIDCRPGGGPFTHEFRGLNGPPPIVGEGLTIIASAEQMGSLNVDSPVTYRGIQVGVVKDIRLSSHAEAANVTLFIWRRFAVLVRSNSQFWIIKGADIKGSIFSGLSLKLGSVQSLLTGGIAFATPDKDTGGLVQDGTSFVLHDGSEDTWLKWRAKILLPPDEVGSGEQKAAANADKTDLPSVKHE
jgi:paraquat-inducible protein B